MVAREPVDGVAGIPNLLHGEGLSAARDRLDALASSGCRRRGKRGIRHGVRPGQWMWGSIFILLLALRSRRCHRRRGKQSHHSKRSENLRPKTIRHKRLQNRSAVAQLKTNSITIAGKLQATGTGPAAYFAADPCDVAAAGFTNFAAATAAFGCTSVSSVVDCPSTQVTCHLKGILTPETAR